MHCGWQCFGNILSGEIKNKHINCKDALIDSFNISTYGLELHPDNILIISALKLIESCIPSDLLNSEIVSLDDDSLFKLKRSLAAGDIWNDDGNEIGNTFKTLLKSSQAASFISKVLFNHRLSKYGIGKNGLHANQHSVNGEDDEVHMTLSFACQDVWLNLVSKLTLLGQHQLAV